MQNLVCVEDFEREAQKILDQNAFQYIKYGAGRENTLRENRNAFGRWIIRPRMMRDISVRDLSTIVLGKRVNFPVGISPTGLQKLAHEDGEIATSRAAAAMGTIFILSCAATTSPEEIAKANPNGRKWLHVLIFKDRYRTLDLISAAEENGFEALVLTVDRPVRGKSFTPAKFSLPKRFSLPMLERGNRVYDLSGEIDLKPLDEDLLDLTLTWKDVTWLKRQTKLKVIVKGILTAEDARLAISSGVDGISVSNHGGRQLDDVSATIDALPEIVEEVNGRCDVFLDGGVRTGTDVIKALALGAKMVFAGRPFLWGLAVGGENGAKRVLEIFKEELDNTMALAGLSNVESIDKTYIARASYL